jgi:hypothetical protein
MGKGPANLAKERLRAIPVLDIGAQRHHFHHEAYRIHQ